MEFLTCGYKISLILSKKKEFAVFWGTWRYGNSQNTAISLKCIHSVDKIEVGLNPRVRNSTTHLTLWCSNSPSLSSDWLLWFDSAYVHNAFTPIISSFFVHFFPPPFVIPYWISLTYKISFYLVFLRNLWLSC